MSVLMLVTGSKFRKLCMQNRLNLLNASVRHLGTDINYVVLENLYKELKDKVEFRFRTECPGAIPWVITFLQILCFPWD